MEDSQFPVVDSLKMLSYFKILKFLPVLEFKQNILTKFTQNCRFFKTKF